MTKSIFQTALAAATFSAALSTGAAFAHATLETQIAQADNYFKVVLRVRHGCDGKATNDVIIELPHGFYGAKPMSHHGFDMKVEHGAYEQPITLHGRESTEGVRKVTWSGGVVENWAYDEFVVFGRIGNVTAGDTLYFKTTQLCGAEGKVAWNEIPVEGKDRPKHPAPGLKIVENPNAHTGHHGMAKMEMHGMVMAGDLHIDKAWTRATPNGAPAGGAFLTITNKGDKADRLIGASSEVSKVVEVHEMSITDGVMKMAQLVDGLVIEPGATIELKPGSFHLMLIGLNDAIQKDQMVKITLEFEQAGKVDVMFPAAQMGAPSMDHSNH
ncbi:DUF1775 domain-containing protein [Maritalea sp.]|uniref:DUF1775 domain-containing protein n=1 Tax=Maritalea sp. TaxID=2003361 RepID=UPI003EF516BE